MSDDFISREAALETLTQQWNELAVSQVQKYTIERSKERISAIPSSNVAPVKCGEWVEKECQHEYYDEVTTEHYVACDQCGQNRVAGIGLANYCPNCGAKMDG